MDGESFFLVIPYCNTECMQVFLNQLRSTFPDDIIVGVYSRTYIATLKEIRLLDRITPCGKDETTKRTVYQITDNFYTFWYRYIFANRSNYELLGEEDAAQEITSDLSNLMGAVFERVCRQYMVRMAKARKLPFVPFKMGKWWGNNPVKRRQDDIDILALDRTGSRAIFWECRRRDSYTRGQQKEKTNFSNSSPGCRVHA